MRIAREETAKMQARLRRTVARIKANKNKPHTYTALYYQHLTEQATRGIADYKPMQNAEMRRRHHENATKEIMIEQDILKAEMK